MQKNIYYQLVLAGIFTALMVSVPWETLQGWKFVDRLNYFNYFKHEENILEYKEFVGVLDYLFGEVLWHYLVAYLIRDLGVSTETVFLFITSFCIGTFALFLIRRHNPVYLLLLINPLLITLSFSQLRIALAFSLLIIAYMFHKKIPALFIIAVSLFIHTATIFFIGVYILIKWLPKYLGKNGESSVFIYAVFLFSGFFLSIILGPFLGELLSYFGDRRAVHYTGNESSSLLYTSYWIGFLVLCAFQDKSFYKDEVNLYSIIILSVVSFNLITGGYTLRFIAVSLPMIFSSMLSMKGNAKVVSLTLYVIYASFQWIYWLPVQVI